MTFSMILGNWNHAIAESLLCVTLFIYFCNFLDVRLLIQKKGHNND